MSQEWYLLGNSRVQLSGYEDDAFNDFATEGFNEILDSELATTIKVYNYDLSTYTQIDAIVQNNLQDTVLKTLSRTILVPINSCKAGKYIEYKNRFWLITGLVDDNGMYEKAVITLCNYKLTWIGSNGNIVQRWANVKSASQYNNGETSNQFFFVGSDQLLISLSDDTESLLIKSGDRFIIDRRCEVYQSSISNNILCDTSHEVITYKATRLDSVLYDYQDSGYFEIMVYQDEQHEDDGYYVVGNKGYWLCEKPYIQSQTKKRSEIIYDTLEIYNGLEAGVFTAIFYDSDGNVADITPTWEIDCDFSNQLKLEYVGNSVKISVNNKRLNNKSFELSLCADDYTDTTITVTIKPFI